MLLSDGLGTYPKTGFVVPTKAPVSKWMFCSKAKTWCEVIVCFSPQDFQTKAATTRCTRSWCLVATQEKTLVDSNDAWCRMQDLDTGTLKVQATSKKSLLRFEKGWQGSYGDLRMLGMWREL